MCIERYYLLYLKHISIYECLYLYRMFLEECSRNLIKIISGKGTDGWDWGRSWGKVGGRVQEKINYFSLITPLKLYQWVCMFQLPLKIKIKFLKGESVLPLA